MLPLRHCWEMDQVVGGLTVPPRARAHRVVDGTPHRPISQARISSSHWGRRRWHMGPPLAPVQEEQRLPYKRLRPPSFPRQRPEKLSPRVQSFAAERQRQGAACVQQRSVPRRPSSGGVEVSAESETEGLGGQTDSRRLCMRTGSVAGRQTSRALRPAFFAPHIDGTRADFPEALWTCRVQRGVGMVAGAAVFDRRSLGDVIMTRGCGLGARAGSWARAHTHTHDAPSVHYSNLEKVASGGHYVQLLRRRLLAAAAISYLPLGPAACSPPRQQASKEYTKKPVPPRHVSPARLDVFTWPEHRETADTAISTNPRPASMARRTADAKIPLNGES